MMVRMMMMMMTVLKFLFTSHFSSLRHLASAMSSDSPHSSSENGSEPSVLISFQIFSFSPFPSVVKMPEIRWQDASVADNEPADDAPAEILHVGNLS